MTMQMMDVFLALFAPFFLGEALHQLELPG